MYCNPAFIVCFTKGLPNVSLTLVQDRNSSTNCDVINPTTSCRVHPVSIVCQFNGSVPLLVQILHNAVILVQQTVTDNQRSLQHNATNHLSSGVYQCIATNLYGSIQTNLYVLVQGIYFRKLKWYLVAKNVLILDFNSVYS